MRGAVFFPLRASNLLLGALSMAALATCAACAAPADARPELLVGAAASLRPVVIELAERFEGQYDARVTVVAGASGTLAHQVRQGAPLDLFIAADARFTEELARDGLLDASSIVEAATGEMVMVTTLPDTPDDPAVLLRQPSVERVALANPELAPYGAAARRYLESVGVWQEVADRVVYGENVAQAFQFVASGNAEVGFVPLSLFLASMPDGVRSLGLPPESSAGLLVTAGIPLGANEETLAHHFITLMRDPAEAETWERFGYRPMVASVASGG